LSGIVWSNLFKRRHYKRNLQKHKQIFDYFSSAFFPTSPHPRPVRSAQKTDYIASNGPSRAAKECLVRGWTLEQPLKEMSILIFAPHTLLNSLFLDFTLWLYAFRFTPSAFFSSSPHQSRAGLAIPYHA